MLVILLTLHWQVVSILVASFEDQARVGAKLVQIAFSSNRKVADAMRAAPNSLEKGAGLIQT